MSRVLDHIHQDHRNMIQLLEILESEVKDLASGSDHDYSVMSDIVDYFNHYPTHFHHPYEDKLFEWIGIENPSLRSLIDELQTEHEAQATLGNEMSMFLQGIRTGHMVPREAVVKDLTEYIRVQRDHIDKEEGRLLKEVENLLEAKRAIEIPLPDRDTLDPLFGDKVDTAFSLIADALER